MLPQPIELDKIERKDNLRHESNKRPAPYAKGMKKSQFPPELEEGSLEALKQLISNQHAMTQEVCGSADAKIDPSSQVGALYAKLIESIVSVHTQGIQETTFFLDGDAFSNSIFHGAKITITEYSTAPKIFNIDFSAHSKAVVFFEIHAAELLIALQKKDLGFTVNRLDTSLMSEDERYALPRVERDLEKEDHA